jgi:hypothetical protein
MNYKLIKLEQGYIIVSDGKIGEGDLYYSSQGILKSEETYFEDKRGLKTKHLNHELWSFPLFKIIASTFIPELPNIDFNDLEEEFSIVDVENLAKKYLDSDERLCNNSFNGFIEGFNKCLELNKDKLYTEEQLREALSESFKASQEGYNIISDEIIQSLQPKTVWNIEVEMESTHQHKVTNNLVKILKV